MQPEHLDRLAAVQRLELRQIRQMFDTLEGRAEHLDVAIQAQSAELDDLAADVADLRRQVLAAGAVLPDGADLPVLPEPEPGSGSPWPERPGLALPKDLEACTPAWMDAYLASHGINPHGDPLLAVLDDEALEAIKAAEAAASLPWTRTDYAVVGRAGLVATLLDVCLVRIPMDTRFLGTIQKGSPLTGWLREHSGAIHKRFGEPLEVRAEVPYDASDSRGVGGAVCGLCPWSHRLQSLGHDPLLCFVFGVADLVRGTGTYVDMHGKLIILPGSTSPLGLTGLPEALVKAVAHVFSDAGTGAGVPAPGFGVFQLLLGDSPFILGPSGKRVTWPHLTRWMYHHGYDLRAFLVMGIVPAAVELIVRGWWLLDAYRAERDPRQGSAKLASMLLLAHTIAVSGNLLKTGLVFDMNPLALNYAELMAAGASAVSWIRASAQHNREIRRALDDEWLTLFHRGVRQIA